MLKRSRPATILLALGLVAVPLAACSDDDDPAVDASSATTAGEADDEEAEADQPTDDLETPEEAADESEPADFEPELEGGDEFPERAYDGVFDVTDRPSDDEIEAELASAEAIETEDREPTPRAASGEGGRSGGTIGPGTSASYRGMPGMFWYDNFGPGIRSDNACGPAAAATVLADWGVIPQDPSGQPMSDVYNRYPPNLNDGNWGSTPDRVQSALAGYGMGTYWGNGEASLKQHLDAGYPVIVLLDLGAMGQQWWTAHYVVVFGYDAKNVYATNWSASGKISWGKFNAGYRDGTIVKGAGTSGSFLVGYL